MSAISIPDVLYEYNLWANRRLFSLCEGLTDSQLDDRREMGFGSLRNTIFHILAAEEIWLERWTRQPWRAFEVDANSLALPLIHERLDSVHQKRSTFLRQHHASLGSEYCEYKDAKGNEYRNVLRELVIHVANHGVHHRAQALSYLKRFERKVPGGLDFLFYRFSRPAVTQTPEALHALRQWGLEIETSEGLPIEWNADIVERYFNYGDWANDRCLNLLQQLTDEQLDRDHGMGVGTPRLTALHILDAERWWIRNWTQGPSTFEKLPATITIREIRAFWDAARRERNQFLRRLDAISAQRLVLAQTAGVSIQLPVVDSLLQLCGHGTHHRSQLINMIRHSNVSPPAVDYIVWVREAAT